MWRCAHFTCIIIMLGAITFMLEQHVGEIAVGYIGDSWIRGYTGKSQHQLVCA